MKALDELGLRPVLNTDQSISFRGGSFKNGKLQISSAYTNADQIRQRYASKIVNHAAQQFGFKVQDAETKTKGAIAAFKLVKATR